MCSVGFSTRSKVNLIAFISPTHSNPDLEWKTKLHTKLSTHQYPFGTTLTKTIHQRVSCYAFGVSGICDDGFRGEAS